MTFLLEVKLTLERKTSGESSKDKGLVTAPFRFNLPGDLRTRKVNVVAGTKASSAHFVL